MPFKIITIPFEAGKDSFVEEDLNKFCLNKRILCCQEFPPDSRSDSNQLWQEETPAATIKLIYGFKK